ncbi:hypothetical protein KIPB_006271, partial [Kipferlia bialata]
PVDRPCECCEKSNADVYCTECGGFYCNTCDIKAHSNRLLARHLRIPVAAYVPPPRYSHVISSLWIVIALCGAIAVTYFFFIDMVPEPVVNVTGTLYTLSKPVVVKATVFGKKAIAASWGHIYNATKAIRGLLKQE